MTETAVTLQNAAGQTLVGVWHEPAAAPDATPGASSEAIRAPLATLVLLHGWSGYRTGPHQMLTRAARAFCAAGYPVLRFDFAGRGDSEGDTELATLATMREDARTALQWCAGQASGPLVLVGLCSGCEIAVATAGPEVSAVVLWSAPEFAALPSSDTARAKRGANLKRYAQKLLKLATWKKLITGKVDRGAVAKAVAGGGGAAARNIESNIPGQLPTGFRQKALDSWQNYDGAVLATYGTADPIAQDAAAWYLRHSKREPHLHWVAGANHSYYGLGWEAEVIGVTLTWLKDKVKAA